MTDTKFDINCPACGKVMKKIWTDENFFVDVCSDGCGGIWFDNRELDKFSNINKDATIILKEYKNKQFIDVDESVVRKCPVCRTKMVKNNSVLNADVEIDECYICGGKFLDKGELLAIRNSKLSKNDDIIKVMDYLLPDSSKMPDVNQDKIRKLLIELIDNI